MPTLIDTNSNLTQSSVIVPDGMLVKEKNSDFFKIGNGKDTYENLKWGGGGGYLPYTTLPEYKEGIQVVGKWIDNRPIYRWLVNVTTGPTPNVNNSMLSVEDKNIDIVFSISGFYVSKANASIPCNFSSDVTTVGTWITSSKHLAERHNIDNMNSCHGVLFIDYVEAL